MLHPSPERGQHYVPPLPALDLVQPPGHALLDMLTHQHIVVPDDVAQEVDAAGFHGENLPVLLDGQVQSSFHQCA